MVTQKLELVGTPEATPHQRTLAKTATATLCPCTRTHTQSKGIHVDAFWLWAPGTSTNQGNGVARPRALPIRFGLVPLARQDKDGIGMASTAILVEMGRWLLMGAAGPLL